MSFLRSKSGKRETNTGGNGLHDLFCLVFVIHFQSVEVPGGPELELSDIVFIFLDSDLFTARQVLVLSPHLHYEFLKILNFLGLQSVSGNLLP